MTHFDAELIKNEKIGSSFITGNFFSEMNSVQSTESIEFVNTIFSHFENENDQI